MRASRSTLSSIVSFKASLQQVTRSLRSCSLQSVMCHVWPTVQKGVGVHLFAWFWDADQDWHHRERHLWTLHIIVGIQLLTLSLPSCRGQNHLTWVASACWYQPYPASTFMKALLVYTKQQCCVHPTAHAYPTLQLLFAISCHVPRL